MDKNTLIKVTNRGPGSLGYTIQDLGVTRYFHDKETKELTFEELLKLSYSPGGMNILKNNLIIDNQEAIEELFGSVEPEYYYSEDDVSNLLLHGSLEQVQDCLDFAPKSVMELVKKIAVELKINDYSKREAIKAATGFDVNKAIEISQINAEEESGEANAETDHVAPATGRRRVAPPSKYKVTSYLN